MANIEQGKQGSKGQQSTKGGVQRGEIGSPISNEAYDIINALAHKLEGLEAFRKYSHNTHEEVWKQLSDLDQQAVDVLCDQLEQICRDGRLRGQTESSSTIQ